MAHDIAGKWIHKYDSGQITYVFSADGKYILDNDTSGTYKISGDLVSVSHRDDIQFLIKGNQLFLTFGDGVVVTNSDGSNVIYNKA